MTTSMQTRSRQPKGIRVGGEFATELKGEATLSLTEAPPCRAFADVDEVWTAKYDSIDDKLAAYKAELDAAVEHLATDENWLNYLNTMSQFHRYSFQNQLLIALQTDGRATRVAGFRAWKEKFGRTVNKGEKSIGILAPKTAWATEKDKAGNPVKIDGKAVKRKVIVGWTTAAVFDVSQTDGEPLPSIEQELSETPPEGFVDDMTRAAEAAGYTVEYLEMNSHSAGSAQGWTDPREKKIVIDGSLTPGSQAATLAHELGHVYAGHCDDLDKYHTGPGGCRGRFEVEAESIAYGITRANQMSMDGSKLSAQYVAGWSRHGKDALRESAEKVAKATKSILASTKFRNVDE